MGIEETDRANHRLRDVAESISADLEDGRSLLEELRRSNLEGEKAHAAAVVKIVAPAVPKPLPLESSLEAQLEDIAERSARGAWREACTALEQWTLLARSLVDQADRITAENRAPIEERNQLRGRLDAYQAKAGKLGLIEDLELSSMFAKAHEALYTAPTDLARAAELVRCYQGALEERPAGEVLR
jgi:hypothetical protein